MSALAERKVEDSPSVESSSIGGAGIGVAGKKPPKIGGRSAGVRGINWVEVRLALTERNEKWLQNRVDSGEFASIGDVINELIWREREPEYVREQLILAEQSGFAPQQTCEEMLAEFKAEARANGLL